VRSFHAAGDGVTDDTEALRRAIRSVEGTGGVVYFPDGDYLLSGVLFVHGNGTVLRGQSRDGTRLVFTRPLDAALAVNADEHGHSRWQWTGGLIWFAPRDRYTYPRPGERWTWRGDGPLVAPVVTALTAARGRGERTLEVADASRLRPGALLMVAVDAAPELVAEGWRREPRPSLGPDVALVRWPVEVAAIAGKQVTLAQPLRFDLPLSLHPRLERIPEKQILRECGLEHMTLVMRRDQSWTGLTGVSEPFGWNGPFFQGALHGFARDLTLVDVDQAFTTATSKNITFSDLTIRVATTPGAQVERRGFATRASSHDVLVDRMDVDPRYRFKIRVEGSGHALSRITGHLDWLSGIATDTAITDLTVPGARKPLPALAGKRVVGWRLDAGERPAALPNLLDAERALAR
jgi:Pectate lyase superfamily protein